jgi:urease accessory protein
MKAVSILRRAAVKPEQAIASVSLNHQSRRHPPSHLHLADHRHVEVAAGAQKPLHEGDALKLEDGSLILVRAETENLLRITSDQPARLMRLAYQLGSQHVPVECHEDELFSPSHTSLAEFIRGQGCKTEEVMRSFEPENGTHQHHDEHHHHHNHDDDHHGCCGHHH